jgi:hypothetical protein
VVGNSSAGINIRVNIIVLIRHKRFLIYVA